MSDSYEVNGVRVYTEVLEALELLKDDKVIGFDLETSGFSPWTEKIGTVQLYGDDSGVGALLHVRGTLPVALIAFFERPNGPLFVGHNITAFDCLFLKTHGVDVFKARWYDSLTIEMVVAGYGRKNVSMSLKDALARRLGVEVDKDIEHGHWMDPVLTEEQRHYAMCDVISLPALRRAQLDKAKESDQLMVVDFEMDLLPAVLAMELNGLPVSKERFDNYLAANELAVEKAKDQLVNFLKAEQALEAFAPPKEFTKTGKQTTASIRARQAPMTEWINLNSPQQVRGLLAHFGLQLPNTKEETLVFAKQQALDDQYMKQVELLDILLRYRTAEQRCKMYGGTWYDDFVVPDKNNKAYGRIHPKYRQCGADTGRFTCKEPNIQQIPKEPVARQVFGGRPGWKIISCDYSAIEVRVAAYLAQDEALLKALGYEDFHTAVASMVFGIPMEHVTKDQRKIAKAMSFTLLFGGKAPLLYKNAKLNGATLTLADAEEMVDKFFKRFEGISRQRKAAQEMANKKRVLWIKLPNGLKRMLTGDTLRPQVILNTTVQGSAGVGLKRALITLAKDPFMRDCLVATVHDEIVACVPEEHAERYALNLQAIMCQEMTNLFRGKVPIKAEYTIADTWGGELDVEEETVTREAGAGVMGSKRRQG